MVVTTSTKPGAVPSNSYTAGNAKAGVALTPEIGPTLSGVGLFKAQEIAGSDIVASGGRYLKLAAGDSDLNVAAHKSAGGKSLHLNISGPDGKFGRYEIGLKTGKVRIWEPLELGGGVGVDLDKILRGLNPSTTKKGFHTETPRELSGLTAPKIDIKWEPETRFDVSLSSAKDPAKKK